MELLIVIVIAIAFLAGFIIWLKLKKEPEKIVEAVFVEPRGMWEDAYTECQKRATDAFVRGDQETFEKYTKRADEAVAKFKEEFTKNGKRYN